MKLWPGLGVAALLSALSIGTLVMVALKAQGGATLGAADWAAIRFTLTQAILSAVLSVLLAIPVARALARRQFRGRRSLIALLGAPFLLPVIVAVLGLLSIYGRNGLFSAALQLVGLGPISIYGLKGVVLAHVFFNMPLATRLFLQGWQAIPEQHFRLAAQLGMRTGDINRRLETPMLKEVAPGALAVIFLLSVTSFAVALTLGGGPRATTIELAIYQAFRFDFDLAKAALLAVAQFTIGALAAYGAWKLAAPTRFGVSSGGLREPERWDCQARSVLLRDAGVLLAAMLFLFLPLMAIFASGLAGLTALPLSALGGAILRSVLVAFGAAGLTLCFALALGFAIVRLERSHAQTAGLIEGLGALFIAASPMMIGTGLFIFLFPLVDPVALALPITALVNATMSLPFALRAILPALRQSEQGFGHLADSLGMQGWGRFRLLTWPTIRRPALFSTGLAAALSMGDLGVIALFADPQSATLPLMLYRLTGSYQIDAANGAALILVLLSFTLFWIFEREANRET